MAFAPLFVNEDFLLLIFSRFGLVLTAFPGVFREPPDLRLEK